MIGKPRPPRKPVVGKPSKPRPPRKPVVGKPSKPRPPRNDGCPCAICKMLQIKTMTGDLRAMAGDVEASNSRITRLLYNRLKAINKLFS